MKGFPWGTWNDLSMLDCDGSDNNVMTMEDTLRCEGVVLSAFTKIIKEEEALRKAGPLVSDWSCLLRA